MGIENSKGKGNEVISYENKQGNPDIHPIIRSMIQKVQAQIEEAKERNQANPSGKDDLKNKKRKNNFLNCNIEEFLFEKV